MVIPAFFDSLLFFFFSSRRRHTRLPCDWSSDVCSSDLLVIGQVARRQIITGAQVREADFDINQTSAVIAVPAGKRAMAVSIGELTGVGKLIYPRSEERRVGKECRSGWSAYH